MLLKLLLRLLPGLASALLLAACDGFTAPVSCLAHYTTGERPGWQLEEQGVALHLASGSRWYRCPAGMTWAANRCQGEALRTGWTEAMAYASEFSEKSGLAWSLPDNGEFGSIQESACNNPSLNPQVFGGLEVENYWTSSRTLHHDSLRCSLYTYGGEINCRTDRTTPLPFLLRLEQ
ncbi:MAG: DUF1566 domain-containing protein [Pseudohongiellaceae bacterium]